MPLCFSPVWQSQFGVSDAAAMNGRSLLLTRSFVGLFCVPFRRVMVTITIFPFFHGKVHRRVTMGKGVRLVYWSFRTSKVCTHLRGRGQGFEVPSFFGSLLRLVEHTLALDVSFPGVNNLRSMDLKRVFRDSFTNRRRFLLLESVHRFFFHFTIRFHRINGMDVHIFFVDYFVFEVFLTRSTHSFNSMPSTV